MAVTSWYSWLFRSVLGARSHHSLCMFWHELGCQAFRLASVTTARIT
jgi:hypothetical protein